MNIETLPSLKDFCHLVADTRQIKMHSYQDMVLDRLSRLYAEREELLLAVVAAGVPVGCIALTPVEQKSDRYGNYTLHAGFRFTTSEVYWSK